MRVLRIIGDAPNLATMGPPEPGTETWCANHARGCKKWLPRILSESEWTRWFNLHSEAHMAKTYHREYAWLGTQTKPIYTQKHYPSIPTSIEFPRERVQAFFSQDGGRTPFRYFSCSLAWLMAFAIMEGFEVIELWGIQIGKHKPAYSWERPCVFWWIQEAQRRGIEVRWPSDLDWDFENETGNPAEYTGPLYGYSTKPEADWNPITETFGQ